MGRAASSPDARPEELASLRARVAELERANAAKERLMAVLGHDLRAPLGAILGWAARLRTEPLDEAQRARALEIIERNARVQGRLIEQVMTAAQVGADRLPMTRAPIELGTVVEQVVDGFLPAASQRRIELAFRAVEGVVVMADRERIERVVTNLVANALAYTEAGGHVTVSVTRENGRACLLVADDGRGIDAALLPRLFELGVRGAPMPQGPSGLGLGLHIVKEIVEWHGGVVSAESGGPGQGARFTVRLLLHEGSVSGTRAKTTP